MADTNFGERLRALRKAAGMTQEELARKADLSASWLPKAEKPSADPSWSTVLKLANALGVSVAAFAEGNGAGTQKKPRTRKSKS